MTDRLRSWIRTTLPAAWGTVAAWLVSTELIAPDAAADVQAGAVAATTPVAIGLLYAGVRWVEPKLPRWARRLVLGSDTPPTYRPPAEVKLPTQS